MEINTSATSTTVTLTIRGHITGIGEVAEIKNILAQNDAVSTVELKLIDAFVIPSMLIGFLLKEAQVKKKAIIFISPKDELKSLINELNLSSILTLR